MADILNHTPRRRVVPEVSDPRCRYFPFTKSLFKIGRKVRARLEQALSATDNFLATQHDPLLTTFARPTLWRRDLRPDMQSQSDMGYTRWWRRPRARNDRPGQNTDGFYGLVTAPFVHERRRAWMPSPKTQRISSTCVLRPNTTISPNSSSQSESFKLPMPCFQLRRPSKTTRVS